MRSDLRRWVQRCSVDIVLRERYLRDDVGCGIERCRACLASSGDVLPFLGDRRHPLFPNGHFVLPDTNVFLSQVSLIEPVLLALPNFSLQMDLMESTLFTPPIILLQTVLEEVRHRSLPLYNRVKALAKMDDKRVWVFYNEYRS